MTFMISSLVLLAPSKGVCFARSYSNVKQIFHAFLFNIKNYSPEVINIKRREAKVNIILPRVKNFDIKQIRHGIFLFR